MNVYLDSEHEEAMQNILTSSDPKVSVDAYVLEAFSAYFLFFVCRRRC